MMSTEYQTLQEEVLTASRLLESVILERARVAARDPASVAPLREQEARARLELRLAQLRLNAALRAEADEIRRAESLRQAELRRQARAEAVSARAAARAVDHARAHAALRQEIEAAAQSRAAAEAATRRARELRAAAARGDEAARRDLREARDARIARRGAGEVVPPTEDDRQEIQRRVRSPVDGGDENFRIRMMAELLCLPEDEVRAQLHWAPAPAKRGARPKVSDDQVRLLRRTTDPMPLVAARLGISVAYAYQIRSRTARAEVPDDPASV